MSINKIVIPIVNKILDETRKVQAKEEAKSPNQQLPASKKIELFRKIVRNVVDEVHDNPETFLATDTLDQRQLEMSSTTIRIAPFWGS